MSEHSQFQNGAPACSYGSLGNYNQPYSNINPPPQGKTISGRYIVPAYEAIGYNSLEGAASCQQYPNINQAYGMGAAKCNTQYRAASCGMK